MPNQTVLLKIGKGLRTPDFSSYCDFCPGRRGDGGEGKCVVQKASRPMALLSATETTGEVD